ncbi:MFS transporter [Roseibium sp.]|uniref:MFS transporter n=1 Tax=Roseibium sp. TaxID=1936156 RepID=UPI003B52DFC0
MTKHFTSNFPAETNIQPPNLLGLTAAGLAIVAATYGLARYCFGLFLPEIRQEFALSTETIGLIAGLSYAGYLIATFAGSWLSTMVGPRLPIFLGGLSATAGMTLIGISQSPEILAIGVFVAGMSPGLAYPPFSDVIVHHIETKRQNAIYAWINSGTGFGVALAGPLALFASEDWRLAWLIFAGLAGLFTIWNMAILPRNSPRQEKMSGVPISELLNPSARPLFAAALLFGIVTAIYWTYAVDLLLAITENPATAVVFWIVLGTAGITGCFAGGLVNRWGLRSSYGLLLILIGGAIATLPVAASIPSGIYYSAASFGAGFIITTALFGMWSMRIFRNTPSIGFGLTFFLISLGQGIGPVAGGYLAPQFGLPAVFVSAGLLCFVLALFRPAGEFHGHN